MPQFHETVMGHRFFEQQLPKFLRELERLNTNLEALAKQQRQEPPAPRALDDGLPTHPSHGG